MESCREALEQRDVCLVPHRRPDRMDAETQLMTDDRGQSGEDLEAHVGGQGALDSQDFRMGDPDQRTDRASAHAGCHPRDSELLADAPKQESCPARGTLDSSLSGWHRRTMPRASLPAVVADFTGGWNARRYELDLSHADRSYSVGSIAFGTSGVTTGG